MHPKHLSIVAIAVLSILLSTTLARPDTPDPITADPAGIAARVTLPDGIDLPDDGAVMTLSAVNTETEAVSRERYVLTLSDDRGLYVLSRGDQARLSEQQGTILGWMTQEIDVDGTFNFAIDPCRTGDGPDRHARVSVQLRGETDGPFLPVIDDMHLRRILDYDLAEMPVCPRAG